MRAIIIEDEPRAANRLEKLIQEIDSSIHILAKIESIADSVEFLKSNTDLDLIFSDIQLADGLSFDIFRQLPSIPPIIFTTAFDQYAITAFKNNGIDYLLKPIGSKELSDALNKLSKLSKPTIDPTLLSLLTKQLSSSSKEYKDRFMIKVGQHIKSIPSSEIACFYSLDKSTYALTKDERNYIIDFSLDQLEYALDPETFFRLNRKFIININAPFEITAWSNSRLKIDLSGYTEEMIIVARGRTKEFKQWLGEE